MKLGLRIFLGYFVISAVCFYYPIDWVRDTLRSRYLEGVEDPLVDQANILATNVAVQMENGRFDEDQLYDMYQRIYQKPLAAKIYKLLKTDVDMRVYITDSEGIVIFDSMGKSQWGADYSGWRDVHQTLNGEYGARTTLADPNDPTSSVLFVAAPICVNETLAGVLTVAKPTTNIKYFLEQAKPQIIKVGSIAAITAILFSFFMAVWMTRPIKRLTRYANDIREGRRVALPKLDKTEIGEMGFAFEKMREALAGKQYVEQYVQKLTHEIKSPLSAIRGAAELLREDMPPERQARFLGNIRNEAGRIQEIIDHMLELSALENQKMLQKKEQISFQPLVKTVIESKAPMVSKKKLTIMDLVDDHVTIVGDVFLLHRAIANIIQNAIDFSPPNEKIVLTTRIESTHLVFTVENLGPSIPEYAEDRMFEKFFSLQRPDTGKKSTGLGLNFVKEVAELHGGTIRLMNRTEGGVRAVLRLTV